MTAIVAQEDAVSEKAEPRVLAEFSTYGGMLTALRARAAERSIALSSEETADVSGLPKGYIAKLIGSNPIRRIGALSMGPVLAILGVKLVMIEDADALERYGSRLKQRNENMVHADTVQIVLTDRHMRKIRLKGGQNSRKYLPPDVAKQLARKAANARRGSKSRKRNAR